MPLGQEPDWDAYVRGSNIMANTSLPIAGERSTTKAKQRAAIWNSAVVLLSMLPILWVSFVLLIGLTGALHWWTVAVTSLLAFVVAVVLATADQRALSRSESGGQTSPFLAVISVLYLAKRSSKLWSHNPHSYRVVWLHLLAVALIVIAAIGVPEFVAVLVRLDETRQYFE